MWRQKWFFWSIFWPECKLCSFGLRTVQLCWYFQCGLFSCAQLFNSFPATFMTYFYVTNIPHVSITGSPHMFFILSCAAVLVATFSFIAIIACRPRHHSRSRVTCLRGTSLRLSLRCVGITETRQQQRHNTKYIFFFMKYFYGDTLNLFIFYLIFFYAIYIHYLYINCFCSFFWGVHCFHHSVVLHCDH